MARVTNRKPPIRRKKASKKKTIFTIKFYVIAFFVLLFIGTTYHYRNAILYYFSFKTNKIYKEDKVAQA